MLSYANIEFAYETQRESFSYEDEPRRKDYSRSRANRPRRRSQRRVTLGMAGRRNKRGAF